jgi:glycosyltransferase involved in cell wall biosynthesis
MTVSNSKPPNLLVSVLVPNYNHANYLEQRLNSILNQTYSDIEVIILDDCSTDPSAKILETYKNHPKIKLIYFSPINSGSPFGLWEKGLQFAQGEYMWIAESDDWCEPNFLEEIMIVFKQSDAVMVHSNSWFFRNNQLQRNDWWDSFASDNWSQNYVKNGTELLKQFGRFKCPVINVSSAVFKKSIIKPYFIPINYRYVGDWKFWVDVFNSGNIGFVAKPLNYFRLHENSATAPKKSNAIIKFKENVSVLIYAHNLLNIKPSYNPQYQSHLQIWLSHFIFKGEYFKLSNHLVNLPLSFKFAFYPILFKLMIKRLKKKIKKTIS